jgi:hypothetical protein
MKKGVLSYTLDSENNKVVDPSELARAYGDQCDFSRESKEQSIASKQTVDTLPTLHAETLKLHDQLISQYKSQVDDLREALAKAQEGLNRTTLLLEHHSDKDKGWQEQLQRLEKLVSNQQEETIKLKRALQTERSKSVWQRLFS